MVEPREPISAWSSSPARTGLLGSRRKRDVVRALAEGAEADEVWVAHVMTDDVVIADPRCI
jgi:hypothetical protein